MDSSGGGVPVRRVVCAAAVLTIALPVVAACGASGSSGSSTAHPTVAGSPHPGATSSPAAPAPPPQPEGLHFSDVTAAAGLASPQSNVAMANGNSMTGGAAACDLFGDGRTDIYVTRIGLPNELFRDNGDGTFSDVATAAGVQGADATQGYAAATCGDLNGDGHPDLYVTGAGTNGNVLYLNNGDGTFTDATTSAGLTLPPVNGVYGTLMYGSAFGDFDHDGRLDIVTLQWNIQSYITLGAPYLGVGPNGAAGIALNNGVCNASLQRLAQSPKNTGVSRSRLYRNDGNDSHGIPHFSDVTTAMGLDFSNILGFTPTFVDLTGNGWDDLVVSGDTCTSQVFTNNDGKGFTNDTAASGTGTAENGMGNVFADFTGSGLPDWFETSISYPGACPTAGSMVGCTGNRMYVNSGNGTFRDATDSYGVRDGGWGWGAVAADFNNSGRLSLAEADGMLWAPNQLLNAGANKLYSYYRYFATGSPFLWLNSGGAPFTEVAKTVGLTATGREKAMIPIDVNRDGRVGLFITNTGQNPVLYENDSSNSNGWITIRLHDDTTANRFGVGAKVKVVTVAGGPTQDAEMLDGGSFESSNPLELHFGLGPGVTRVAEIDVMWPGQSQPQVLTNVAADRYLDITRG